MFRSLFNSVVALARAARSAWLAVEESHQYIMPVVLAVLQVTTWT